jgi:cytochrome c biogenesis protein CcmG/thiol:disulfide interchange protein DsbE
VTRALRASLVALLVVVAAGGCRIEGEDEALLEAAPETAPGFTLPLLRGGEVSLESLRGRPVVIDFWATWCAPCVHQIPVLNAFQERHGEDVVVLGISVDTDGREVVERFAAEHDIGYRVLLGSPGLAQRYGAIGFPSLYVIGPDGAIDTAHVGVVAGEDLDEALARVRSRPPAP